MASTLLRLVLSHSMHSFAIVQLVTLLLLGVSAVHVSCFVLVGTVGLLHVPLCRVLLPGVVSCQLMMTPGIVCCTPHILQHRSLPTTSVVTGSADNGKAGVQLPLAIPTDNGKADNCH